MDEFYNKHYIRVREDGAITEGWSDGPHNRREVTDDDILLTDKGGYQFRLYYYAGLIHQRSEENPPLYTMDGIPLYRWDGKNVVVRTEEELAADRAAQETERQAAEREWIANSTETVLLEMAAEHEERLCLLEMGIHEEL